MSIFSKQADLYAQYRPDYPKEMYEHIFNHLAYKRHAWDCATGSGQVAKYLANHFEKVWATDISKEQLSHAPAIKNVTYQVSEATSSGLPAQSIDLITIAQAIHWLDFASFYDEVRRVATKDALLAVIGYGMIRINVTANPIIDELYEKAFGEHYSKNRTYIEERYQTIPFPFEEMITPSFNNKFRWSFDQLEGYFNSWSAIQKIKNQQQASPVVKTMEKLKAKLPHAEPIPVNFPVFMRLCRVH